MKETVLKNRHEDLGAKMVDFAGYYMPLVYSSVQEEHHAVRENVGIFDVSHMGEFIVEGYGALDLLQKITTNDVSKVSMGEAQYNCMTNENGGIVDDLIIYRLEEWKYLMVVNASNIQKDWDWVSKHAGEDVTLKDISEDTGLIAVQGPRAIELLQPLTDVALKDIPFYDFEIGTFAGQQEVIISGTGYTGSGGFELYAPNEALVKIWDAIFALENQCGLKPCGLGARDTLRLEKGYCLYGNDINDDTTPLEAGLSWITKFKKGDFTASDKLKAQKKAGIDKKLVGFVVSDKRIGRQGYKIEDSEGNEIGIVTSGSYSPMLDKPIGLGYVQKDFSKANTDIMINTGRKLLPAVVHKLPLVK